MPRPVALALLTLFTTSGPALAQPARQATKPEVPPNALDDFDAKEHGVAGEWTRTKDGITAAPKVGNRCVVPVEVGANYRLQIEFTRNTGDDVVAILFPVGDVTGVVELSGWEGAVHGLARVDGKPSRDPANTAAVRPGRLENGRRYRVVLDVAQRDGTATIDVQLDGKRLFDWTGKTSRLSPHFAFKLPNTKSVGLGVGDGAVVFHAVRLVGEASASPTSPVPSAPAIALKPNVANAIDLADLATKDAATWEPFNGAAFTVTKNGDRVVGSSRPRVGSGDRGAYLRGVSFDTGTIEIELKGAKEPQSSFLGVAFGGVDGKTYESVYFRPFNFGHADPVRRSHAVQYMAHPEWPWDKLRSQRPGQYESTAVPEPKPEDRFRAKIEITSDRVRVYVNGAEKPAMDVERLADGGPGKVGLWFNGIAEFSRLALTPRP